MSKFRRNNICSSHRSGIKVNNNEMNDISKNGDLKFSKTKLMSHGEFLNRIQKSLYYSGRRSKMSIPLSDYIADSFSETHNGYSLNRLDYSTVGRLRSTPCSLILALVYLERLKDADPAYTKHVTPTELFLVSMMVATKFYSGHDEEAPYVNWTESINTTPDSLLEMELSFLNAIDWKVYVSNEEFFDKVISLEIILARQQGLNRGFFTYLELNSLMPSIQIAKEFIQSVLALSFTYTVFVTTMVASVFLVSQIPGTYLNAQSRNSIVQSDIKTSSAIPSQQPLLSEEMTMSNDSDMSIILNLDIDRLTEASDPLIKRIEPNTTSWIPLLLSSWYSLLKSESFEWPSKVTRIDRMNANIFCNSSANEFSPTHFNMEGFKFNVQGIKMKWV